MIPVLIVPVLNRWDLAERMLASVDVPVGRTIVVDNGGVVGNTTAEVLDPLLNLGFSGAINAVICQTPEAPWWLWASNDIVFGAGDLDRIAEFMDVPGPRVVTGDRADDRLLRFAYAAINQEAIAKVGLLDEWTFYPIYFEDDDYERRCRLTGVEWVEFNGQISHDRSSAIKEPAAAQGNSRTFPENAQRYIAKWGGAPGSETYETPWNLPVPVSYTRVDLPGRARRLW